jgi:hypothetical protein
MADKPQTVAQAQLASYLRQAGFKEDLIPTMIGIGTAESSLNPKAFNPNVNTGDQSYGLFQINMLGAMGPERRELFGIKTNEELFDPLQNAKAAKAIYDQQGLGAWSVYKSGAYKQYVPKTISADLPYGMDPPIIAPDAPLSNSDPVPPTDPATTTNTTPPIYDPNASRFPGLPEGVAYAAYDPSKYKLVENKTKSLRDNFVNNLKNQLLMNVLQNPFGGLF